MGECAGVGIEPDEQTRLVDATESVEGVLAAGVPGAGGVDAVFALVLTPQARTRVEELWSRWGDDGRVVCPLLLSSDSDDKLGVRVEPLVSWS
jgi:phosphomevalonate kinase